MNPLIIFIVAIVVVGFLLLSSTVKIVQEYERGVIFRLGDWSERVGRACSC